MKHSQLSVVVVGGGTGSFTLLSEFKHCFENLTALVNMADDGGSTGHLRDELGVLPPGDVRQCLVALSDSPNLRDLFEYRFREGGLDGHSFGNLFLSAVEKLTGSFPEAVKQASEILRIHGRVLPITTADTHLIMTRPDGQIVTDQYRIAHINLAGVRPELALRPQAALLLEAREAILAADFVVIAPGNLYGSLAPALLVDGVREALEQTRAHVVYVCNLVTKPGQTDNFAVYDYAAEIERFIGAPLLDAVIYNTEQPTPEMLQRYTHEGEILVPYDAAALGREHYAAIGLDLIDNKPVSLRPGDAISQTRSLIRHDAKALARQLVDMSQTENR